MLHDILQVFIAGQSRQLVGDGYLPCVPSLVLASIPATFGGKGVHPLVVGLEDLLHLHVLGRHLDRLYVDIGS